MIYKVDMTDFRYGVWKNDWYVCPNCGFDSIDIGFNYCPGCGEGLKFEVEEGKSGGY